MDTDDAEPAIIRNLTQDVYTVAQVAALLSLSVQTVYQLIATGRLGHLRVGTGTRNSYRVTREQLADYLRSVRREAKPAEAPADRPPVWNGRR